MIRLFVMLSLPTLILAGEISGRVSSEDGEPLAGVNIVLLGTGQGDATDMEGFYRIQDVSDGSYKIQATVIGYQKQTGEVLLQGRATFDFFLEESVVQLSEVTVTGTFATDNTIPVTFTTLQEQEITEKYTVQDIPLLMVNRPGVYVTTDGGSGLGDSQIMIRGFDEKRIQVLVNNIPVNDPESQQVFWSNWGMLPSVAQAIQIQRGVGTSLYGSGALGGSINIITKDAPAVKSTRLVASWGQYGIKKLGFVYNSGLLSRNMSLIASIALLEGNGWRENTYYQGLQYYLSASLFPDPNHTFKIILHGSPQYHTLSFYSFNAATYGNPDQFTDSSQIDGGSGRKNMFGQYAYGFGRFFNGNVHVDAGELSSEEVERTTTIWDVLCLSTRIGISPDKQIGGWIFAKGRASLNNNMSHRPQLEFHHSWEINKITKLTSTFFVTKGIDYSDDVYPYWLIPRNGKGYFRYTLLTSGDYWGADQVFEYRYYSDFFQAGFLSALETNYHRHEFSAGIETRYWKSRHAGEMLNTFGRQQVEVPVGSVEHAFTEGDLFYDFTTKKPRITAFGRARWYLGKVTLMSNLQVSGMNYHIVERVPSNNNYPNYLDPSAPVSHGGKTWTGNATWDHDNNPSTPEEIVTYTLWDYRKSYRYITPRIGINYQFNRQLNLFSNWSIGIKEPQVKHFFGYGSPREDIDLERTEDIELGLRFDGHIWDLPLYFQLNSYQIRFKGKLMQITLPEKANTPGYDYAGHTYVPIGDATYSGLELELNSKLPFGFRLGFDLSKSINKWGEPDGSEGSQKLYANVAVAGVDYHDTNGNGIWDEGGQEYALHRNFVKTYGVRYEVGMPQLMVGSFLAWDSGPFSFGVSVRHHRDLYVLEDNSKIRMGPGNDSIFGTGDDKFSATLFPATLVDMRIKYSIKTWDRTVNLTFHINNVLDTFFWQRGDEYGVAPGPARLMLFNIELNL